MLPFIAADLGSANVVDLGCGNGALGLMAALRNPDAQITFIDESGLRLPRRGQLCRGLSWTQRPLSRQRRPERGGSNSADLILCNPPFHQQQVVGDQIARRLFRQSRQALAPGGTLLVVGNRHLGYHQTPET
ncbi:methyltransferase [Halopseudomonas pachastrellae]|nr:methyltransferase [Halopseudomonas pachastrellae]